MKVIFSNEILSQIRRNFSSVDSISIAVAYVKQSGVEKIKSILKDKDVYLITSFDFSFTEPHALETLQDIGDNINIRIYFGDSDFHPKVYLGESPALNRGIAIVGSSNLSKGGLENNVEANMVLINSHEGPIFSEIKNYFNQLWRTPSTLSLTPDILENYKIRFEQLRNVNRLKTQNLLENRRTLREHAPPQLKRILSDTPQYWLLITSPTNYRICSSLGLWGVEYATNKIQKVRVGDIVFFYIRQAYKIVGPFIVTSSIFKSNIPVWPDKGKLYPWRFRIAPLGDVSEINIKEIIDNMDFIVFPERWGTYLQGEMRLLHSKDVKTILNQMYL